MSGELECIKQFFEEHQIPFSSEWLESCAHWCKENLPTNYLLKDLQRRVYEQWLLLDLREVQVAAFPRNLSKEKKFILPEEYCVQMMQVVDISKPKLWQLQRIRKNVAKNTDPENDFGKRVLQLSLTDGVQEVEAMEFKPISALSINLVPGIKIRIVGPVMVRNGRLMLESENVKILGGEVEEIAVKNAAENVLARALKLEENPNPFTIDEKALEITEVNNMANITQTNKSTSNTQNVIPHTQSIESNQNQNIINQPIPTHQNLGQTNQNINNPQSHRNSHRFDDIPPEYQVDDELLRELEADFDNNPDTNNSKKTILRSQKAAEPSKKPQCKSPDLFDDMDIDEDLLNDHLDHIDLDNITSNKKTIDPTPKSSQKNTKNVSDFGVPSDKNVNVPLKDSSKSNIALKQRQKTDDVIALDDSFDDIDIDAHLDRIDKEMMRLPSSTQKDGALGQTFEKSGFCASLGLKKTSEVLKIPSSFNPDSINLPSTSKFSTKAPQILSPLTSPELCLRNSSKPIIAIEKLKKLLPNVTMGKFRIKGKFKEVVERMVFIQSTYRLVISIQDESGFINLQVHSDLVEHFIGVSKDWMIANKDKILQGDLDAKRQVLRALGKLCEICQNLDGMFEVQVTKGERYPVLLNVL